jgi:DNA modification methylase
MQAKARPVKSMHISKPAKALARLLVNDLEFHKGRSSYASHRLHPFPAKCPPQLPRIFIEKLTRKGEFVLDPMMGSGTTALEALLLNRRSIGFDIDPLALRIARAKTRRIRPSAVSRAGKIVLNRARFFAKRGTPHKLLSKMSPENRDFVRYWFKARTRRELASIAYAIERLEDGALRTLLSVVLSGVIISKSGGVSLARDLSHSRPHQDPGKLVESAFDLFETRLKSTIRLLATLPSGTPRASLRLADCRKLPLPNRSVHLIITSPPYANAIDYVRAHKFSLVWLGIPLKNLIKTKRNYIGSENLNGHVPGSLPPRAQRIIARLQRIDARKAAIVQKYLSDIKKALQEMHRVLKRGRTAVIIVGASRILGMKVDTPNCLADIARLCDFRLVGMKRRRLDRGRRMLPMTSKWKGSSQIERRMRDEYVIGLWKDK